MVVGGLLAAAGTLASSFATDVYPLFFTHGVIGGEAQLGIFYCADVFRGLDKCKKHVGVNKLVL